MTDAQPSYGPSLLKLLLLATALFVVGTNAFVIAGLLPEIAADLRATPSAVSYAITGYALVVAIASPAVALLLPRVPRSTLMAAGVAVLGLGSALAVLAPDLPLFIAGRTLAGLGGAALVPTATAAAAALVPPQRRGRALALVGAGFTLATAVGSPLGTALGEAFGWRAPLWSLVALAALLAVAIPLFVGHVPLAGPASFARRLAPLRDPRILAVLGATALLTAGFNTVYIRSAAVTEQATGGSGTALAALLLVYGLAGVAGNIAIGPVTDRVGNRATATLALAGQIVALAALALVFRSFVADVVVFAVWGVVAFAATVPVQHRLVTIDSEQAAHAISWYSTAMYLGIAIAPPLGAAALATGGAAAVPVTGAIATALALVSFLLGYVRRRTASPALPA